MLLFFFSTLLAFSNEGAPDLAVATAAATRYREMSEAFYYGEAGGSSRDGPVPAEAFGSLLAAGYVTRATLVFSRAGVRVQEGRNICDPYARTIRDATKHTCPRQATPQLLTALCDADAEAPWTRASRRAGWV